MTYLDAQKLLASAPRSSKPSRVNAAMSVTEALDLVDKFVVGEIKNGLGSALVAHWVEKRIWQVVKNQPRPKY